jgi:hypothetical protein
MQKNNGQVEALASSFGTIVLVALADIPFRYTFSYKLTSFKTNSFTVGENEYLNTCPSINPPNH